eukprot:TRINITY_DN13312_c0_g1_i2.p1 TRINITY_DN13312_c0_g1~~TRINITY_DN13312_c0_g1_i2.p1  ORF type:complete len:613 (+),score=137.48 TRINITY_DN13312_c0_g1_i2:214-2052(+)
MTTYFRSCDKGERLADDGTCQVCASGTFRLASDASSKCINCPVNLKCDGKDVIYPEKDYWRFNSWSAKPVECLNTEACLGGKLPAGVNTSNLWCKEQYNQTLCSTGWCSERYRGNLCSQCAPGYATSNEVYCVPCSNNPYYYVIVALIFIGATGFVIFTIRNALKAKQSTSSGGSKKMSIMIKILMNYFQLVSIVSSFSFQWPDQVKSAFKINNQIASSTTQIFSMDCIFQTTLSNSYTKSQRPFFIKLALIAACPILLALLASVVWIVYFLVRYRSRVCEFKDNMKTNIVTSIVILLFMVHTSILQTTFLSFRCQNIGDEERPYSYLERDLDVECWKDQHLNYVLTLAVPSLVVWGFGTPVFAWALLWTKKSQLEDPLFRTKLGFLYDGYRIEVFFWEFIILYRKIAMVFIAVFMSSLGLVFQALAIILVAFVAYVLQIHFNPFTDPRLNALEKRSLINATVTLYCGLYYLNGNLPIELNYAFLVILIIVNGNFLLYWLKELLGEGFKAIFKKNKGEIVPVVELDIQKGDDVSGSVSTVRKSVEQTSPSGSLVGLISYPGSPDGPSIPGSPVSRFLARRRTTKIDPTTIENLDVPQEVVIKPRPIILANRS